MVIGSVSIALLLVFIVISLKTEVYIIGVFMFFAVLTIIAPFYDMPSLKKSGRVIYHSPLFISEKPTNGAIKIHGGTLFDYCFVIDKKMNGKQRTNFILQQYLDGLLSLMEQYKENKHLIVKGTSYIINERTAEKMGFKTIKTDTFQKIILNFNFLNVLLSYSIAKNKLSFPAVNNTKTFQAEIGELIERKEYVENLNQSLKRMIASNY
ncbi:hypothetical protein [Flagellimonas sp.]|uniref:hypothetical protein n=1 Tax=Flagellimonas sp. TaxID=2058762 RepID=UPI003BACD9AC